MEICALSLPQSTGAHQHPPSLTRAHTHTHCLLFQCKHARRMLGSSLFAFTFSVSWPWLPLTAPHAFISNSCAVARPPWLPQTINACCTEAGLKVTRTSSASRASIPHTVQVSYNAIYYCLRMPLTRALFQFLRAMENLCLSPSLSPVLKRLSLKWCWCCETEGERVNVGRG